MIELRDYRPEPNDNRDSLFDAAEGVAMRLPIQIEYNRSLPYPEFLKSMYWRYVRTLMFRNRGRHRGCTRCGTTKERLDVHHKTYDHQGDELNHLEDLTILCAECHRIEHAPAPAKEPVASNHTPGVAER